MANSDPIAYNERIQHFLPDKSRGRYETEYAKFRKWQEAQDMISFTEEVLLKYFGGLARTLAPTTLYTVYSMLKSMLSSKHNVNIGEYSQLLALLKKSKVEFISNAPPRLFTADEVNKFLQEAPDSEYAAVKAVTVFAMCVSTRSDTLTNIKMEQVTDNGTDILVRVPNAATKQIKVCTIRGKLVDFVRKYMRLRPIALATRRFFIQYRDNRCSAQHIGKHAIAKMPQKIAEFLGWPESEIMGGLSFRRISDSITANARMKHISQEKSVGSMCCAAFEVSSIITGRIEAPENNYTKNVNRENLHVDPLASVRIKQEDEQHFEAGEYSFSDIVIKTENESPDDSSSSRSEDHRYHDQNTTITTAQRLYSHELPNSLPSETHPNKRLKCSGDIDDASHSITSCQNDSFCQQTIKAQAEEISRLKQLTDRQNLKIESLETLLLDNLRKKFETS
ncbi:uncharacterized protein LOC119079498 isoform X1 [Bradysia coprophila]|uniref:uncharacterized protein LOC119079498 isoform X1 n=1 Tax=Bradysia coprophila TaxID=38358 RepID=UPI00187DA764|nr:uncharacterized protein LOC119079498 isoform X1 [Bradysia coprophila]